MRVLPVCRILLSELSSESLPVLDRPPVRDGGLVPESVLADVVESPGDDDEELNSEGDGTDGET